MPQGFGYGAVGAAFNAIRGGLGKASAGMYGRAMGAGGLYRGAAQGLIGRGLGGLSRMSNTGLSALAGGIAGGTYGAFSDNTSILGGALGGAALGAGALGATRLGQMGLGRYAAARAGGRGITHLAGGLGRRQAAAAGIRHMGRMSSRLIGRTGRQAFNGFKSTMKAGANAYSSSDFGMGMAGIAGMAAMGL